jgi:hypothetical protein
MSNGIKTLEAADNGITAITKTIEQMQSTLRQARQDKSFQTESYTLDSAVIGTAVAKNLSFEDGAIGTTPVDIGLQKTNAAITFGGATTLTDAIDTIAFDVAVNGGAATTVTLNQTVIQSVGDGDTTIDNVDEFVDALEAALTAAGVSGVAVSNAGNTVNLKSISPSATGVQSVAISGYVETDADADTTDNTGLGAAAAALEVRTVDELVAAINTATALDDKIRASNDNGRLRIENQSTSALTLTGVTATTINGAGASTTEIDGNSVRVNFVNQFNSYIDQLNKLSDDASFNGVNLLRGDKLKITFNEAGTSTIEIEAKDENGNNIAINTSTLGILQATNAEFDSDTLIDDRLTILGDALANLRAHGSAFGSNLSIVQNRQDFTKAMINTLETGADNLVLADSNEEGANMLALQTRQQLSTTALSLSAQADQAVLRLFG